MIIQCEHCSNGVGSNEQECQVCGEKPNKLHQFAALLKTKGYKIKTHHFHDDAYQVSCDKDHYHTLLSKEYIEKAPLEYLMQSVEESFHQLKVQQAKEQGLISKHDVLGYESISIDGRDYTIERVEETEAGNALVDIKDSKTGRRTQIILWKKGY